MDLETIQSKLLRQYQSAGISDIGEPAVPLYIFAQHVCLNCHSGCVRSHLLATGNRGSAASESSSVAVDHSAKLGPAASKVVEGEPIFSNPFAIPRSGLVGQLSLLTARITSASKYLFRQQKQQGGGARKNVMETVKARKLEEAKHSVPITVMGDYHEACALTPFPPRLLLPCCTFCQLPHVASAPDSSPLDYALRLRCRKLHRATHSPMTKSAAANSASRLETPSKTTSAIQVGYNSGSVVISGRAVTRALLCWPVDSDHD
jgi:hypothetical protein